MAKLTPRELRPTENTEQENLWKLFLEGDMNAFRSLYSTHYKMLYNFGKKYLPPTEVEDCIHDTFLNILHYKNSIGEVKKVKTYLFKSFRNQLLKTKKSKQVEFHLTKEINIDNDDPIENETILKEVKKLIEQLSPREKEIVYLKYFQNFNNHEISDLLNIKYQTVRNILAGAIKKLRTLGKDYIHLLFLLIKD
ncbi:sigma-70 family RNA polymerase sigma factor [Muricauda sp. 334s03]|uniref:Sigma-70 family RNA polymerase sigma factor n=1 Tax=Flagellimonas yonaguniensis TaxID=3031325 RepID=A0ABT5Y129_9FLAO|nr:sigma-70 family RNA polymerase sigma factor [[Muricauda] yonaguniensis]MDF0717143.1 sigma-70 family RNA polymerase sigma factor [[Muricauda] yonaguniensis]